MKLSLSLLGCQLATGQYFQTRSLSGLGCRVLDNCQSNQICIVDLDYEQGKCVNVPAIQRRDEEQLPGPQTLGIFVWTWIESFFFCRVSYVIQTNEQADTIYEARQARRKQLLKEKMAKKLWEDQYEGKSTVKSKKVMSNSSI